MLAQDNCGDRIKGFLRIRTHGIMIRSRQSGEHARGRVASTKDEMSLVVKYWSGQTRLSRSEDGRSNLPKVAKKCQCDVVIIPKHRIVMIQSASELVSRKQRGGSQPIRA